MEGSAAQSTATLTTRGILVAPSPELATEVAHFASDFGAIQEGAGRWVFRARLPVLVALKRQFKGALNLDDALARHWRRWNTRSIIRKQIVGEAPKQSRELFASPYAGVLHRPACPWAAQIGANMLVFHTLAIARQSKLRPCKLCSPFDDGPLPTVPDALLPWDD